MDLDGRNLAKNGARSSMKSAIQAGLLGPEKRTFC